MVNVAPARRRHTQPCKVCGQPYGVDPGKAHKVTRCPDCIAGGRTRCGGCGAEVSIRPHTSSPPVLCADCRAAGGVHFPRVERNAHHCSGYRLAGEKTARHARSCKELQGEPYLLTAAQLSRLSPAAYNPLTGEYRSGPCVHAQHVIREQVKLFEDADVTVDITERVRTWADFKACGRAVAELRPRWGTARLAKGWREKTTDEAGQTIWQATGTNEKPRIVRALEAAWSEGHGNFKGLARARVTILSRWRRGLHPRAAYCAVCGDWLLLPSSGPMPFHEPCLAAALETPAGQAWQALQAAPQASSGDDPGPLAEYLRQHTRKGRRPGRPRSGDTPTKQLRWAILHLFDPGEYSLARLGLEAAPQVTPQAVDRGIARVLARMPKPEIAAGDRRLDRLTTLLRAADERRRNSVEGSVRNSVEDLGCSEPGSSPMLPAAGGRPGAGEAGGDPP